MILVCIDLDNNKLIFNIPRVVNQLHQEFPNLDLRLIEIVLEAANDVLHSEAYYLIVAKKFQVNTEDFNREIPHALAIMNSMKDPAYSRHLCENSKSIGLDFRQDYYDYFRIFLSEKNTEITSYLQSRQFEEGIIQKWPAQAHEIAELARFIIDLKTEAITRYIKGERPQKQSTPKSSAYSRTNSYKAKKANERWGSFYNSDAITTPPTMTGNIPEIKK